MSKKVTLTIKERLAALSTIDQFKGTITQLAAILEDTKKIAVTKEDWEVAGKVVTKNEDGSESWTWQDGDEKTWKEIDLNDEVAGYIVKSIKAKSDNNEVTLGDIALISLQTKLS